MPKSLYSGEKPTKTAVDETVPTVTIKSDEILIESLIDAHLTYKGQISGKPYEWRKGGDTVFVLSEDVPALLEKHLGGKVCCGNPVGNKIFQVSGG